MTPSTAHRPAAVAGRFYPGAPDALQRVVRECLRLAAAEPSGPAAAQPPKMLVVPHAGYVYSGPVAAPAYAALARWRDRIHRVVLLGPAHRVALRGIALPGVAAFDTPLGAVPVDASAAAALQGLPQVGVSELAHAQEHALEVQLPFLQSVLGEFTLVPLVVGQADPEVVAQVLERLWGGPETLIVVSTDLSHYLTYDDARTRDQATIARVLALQGDLRHDEACGATPLNGALRLAQRRGLVPRLLDLRNSGDTAGDRSRVVGYAALQFDLPAASAVADEDPDGDAAADDGLGAALLSRARNTIADALGLADRLPEPGHEALGRPGATFVTLQRLGALRGCIGRLVSGEHSLEQDVRHHAHAAAFRDPRFAPLTAAEWPGLSVEVSLLAPPRPMPVADEAHAHRELRPGVDGVVLQWRHHQATFLPQVWEQLPEPGRFLANLKRKAGLAADFWHEELRLSRYTVRKFVEPEAGL